jgi:Rha family phage regulatory protein
MTKTTVLTNSRDVAEMFGKQHQHVLRDIDRLVAQRPDLDGRRFRLALVPHPTVSGRTDRSFDLTEHGCTLLVLGWTGPKVLEFKIRHLEGLPPAHAGDAPEGASAPGGVSSSPETRSALQRPRDGPIIDAL